MAAVATVAPTGDGGPDRRRWPRPATVAPASDGGPDRRRWPRPATVAPTGGGPGDGHEIFEGSFHGAQRTGEPFNNRWLKLIGKA